MGSNPWVLTNLDGFMTDLDESKLTQNWRRAKIRSKFQNVCAHVYAVTDTKKNRLYSKNNDETPGAPSSN